VPGSGNGVTVRRFWAADPAFIQSAIGKIRMMQFEKLRPIMKAQNNEMQDLHQALKFEQVGKGRAPNAGVDFVVVQSQSGKDDIALGLHAAPNQYTTSGIQTPDFMSQLGFVRSGCQFVDRRECFGRAIHKEFDLASFIGRFDEGFAEFKQAEQNLEACGFFFDQMEGWGYFLGKHSSGRRKRSFYELGDGHTVAESKELKQSEDAAFWYRFVWVVTSGGDKGWITHYHPKNPPLSVELEMVFSFLGLKTFASCPHFDFEPCSWTGLVYQQPSEDSFFNRNSEIAHQWFENHGNRFSLGVERLLRAHAIMEPVGMKLLPIPDATTRLRQEFGRHTTPLKPAPKRPATVGHFDVAISFAGTERKFAEELARRVREAGFSVFYDGFYPEDLWGKNLVETFYEIYSKGARYCVIFVSQEYTTRAWTIHERRSAQERMLKERGKEYILPIKADETELPGMPSTIGYVSLRELGIEKISEILLKKLAK
jgi:hypothetical protein